ncbi:MAG TPA: histidine kinase dimerization/phospho-acceptor domain-containing protein [Candidatus Acidoferrales bacterium]|nr:histidine kinase dimerization/phospho-acceptor domain-containing protein [Candidatus Acidoferrales bacterium]
MSELIRQAPEEFAIKPQRNDQLPWQRAAVVVGMLQGDIPPKMVEEVEELVKPQRILTAGTTERLREAVAQNKPSVIVIDARILVRSPLREALTEFAASTHVIAVAPYDRQPEVARLVADGQIDFVPREGEWQSLAVSLVEKRLSCAHDNEPSIAFDSGASSSNLGEIFRHEINNPLTGILGNAELLLAHSAGFPPVEAQRIRTIVELAVRLRETVRRVSNLWEGRFPKSA